MTDELEIIEITQVELNSRECVTVWVSCPKCGYKSRASLSYWYRDLHTCARPSCGATYRVSETADIVVTNRNRTNIFTYLHTVPK